MELVIADSQGHDLGIIDDYRLDLAYGEDENDFELSVPAYAGLSLDKSYRLYMDGMELGGIVDNVSYEWSRFGKIAKYTGRSWQGVLDRKIIKPDSGQAYLTVTGDANTVLGQLISRIGLGHLFTAKPTPSGIDVNYRFNRYVTAYEGIVAMLRVSNAVLKIRAYNGRVELSAAPATTHDLYAEQRDFAITCDYNVVNHLVCLGMGQLQDRIVVDLYADNRGRISQTQSIYGSDEIAEAYDANNSERDQLIEDGTKKLKDYQTGGTVNLDIQDSEIDMEVGDKVLAEDGPLKVSGEVIKKILVVEHGIKTFKYEIGNEKVR